MVAITFFTPTYNRAYILPQLYQSLLIQKNFNFEWLIIDDGSTDHTEELVKQWAKKNEKFKIQYCKTANGGKPRAINKAVELVKSPYIFIIDSDDYLTDDAVEFLLDKIKEIDESNEFAGIGVMRGNNEKSPLGNPLFLDLSYVDATNLERKKHGLNFDCNELYKVEILKKFPFKVWKGELFSPEEIVLNEIALHGYKVRWYNKIGVISEYLNDGLTKNSFDLIKNNPMGYAMAFNHSLKHKKTFKDKFVSAYLLVCYSILGKNILYLARTNNKPITILAFPLGIFVAFRRKMQFKNDFN